MKKVNTKVVIRRTEPAFIDQRGSILDILETTVKHIGIITSKKGSVRGNHYHKKSTQYMYIIKGKMEMKTKNILGKTTDSRIIEEGDMITIPPKTIHSFLALEDSSFLDITTESRKDGGYEKDTVRVKIS